MLIDPFTQVSVVDSLKGLMQDASKLGEQYRKGTMGRDVLGMDWRMDQNMAVHTFGNWTSTAGAITVSGANQGLATGWAQYSTLNLTTTQRLTLQQGDCFQIAGVYAVNPQNRSAYGNGRLRNFVVTSAVTTSSGAFQVTVSPALIYGGQFQNVTASPVPTWPAATARTVISHLYSAAR